MGLSGTSKDQRPKFDSYPIPCDGKMASCAASKVLIVCVPRKALELSYCAANDLLILYELHRQVGVGRDNYQHVSHKRVQPLLKRVYNWFLAFNNSKRGSPRSLEASLVTQL